MSQFTEEQRFQWFFTAIFCIPALIVGYGLYRQWGMSQPSISPSLLWPAFIVAVVVAVWFGRLKMITEVRDDGLYICFVWLWPERTIPWDQIRSVEPRTYRPIRDFGGWGVRWSARGIVYHARGKRGVRLVLASGERILVGSQRPEVLGRAIAERAGIKAGSSV
jgi:hypothetical protein